GSFRAFVIGSPERALAELPLTTDERDLVQQVAALKGYPVFAEVPAQEILYLIHQATREVPQEGVVVTMQGEKEAQFYLIYRGEAAVLVTDPHGRELHVATLGRGNHFGEMALIYDRPRNATIRAGSGLTLLVLDEQRFRDLLVSAPILGRNIQDEARRRLAV
ncbi:MAG: cyclic nucleotide-binding domain-containing protein, partial [Chloroflexi bacterium]|nr:cyclic nucleotide-binding domain-containing protein [Chloroflexota bacterium]